MVENYNSMDLAAFKNVWVFCEQRQGKMMPTTFELISEGRKLADELGVNLCGLRASSAQELHDRRVCQGHLRRHLRDEARGIPHRRDQHRP